VIKQLLWREEEKVGVSLIKFDRDEETPPNPNLSENKQPVK
jgi:hypothetical protein